jgi:hypothetical protein
MTGFRRSQRQIHPIEAILLRARRQLASAKTQRLAEKQRNLLRSKYGDILHDVVVVPANSGKSYRVESAPMSQTEADSACSELNKAHQSCEVIKNEAGKS